MKKTLALLISLVMLCSLCLPVLANNTTGSLLNGAADIPAVYDPENERRNTEKESEMMLSPAYDPDDEGIYSVNLTLEKQITAYHCGPACGVIALNALNVNVPSLELELPFFEECLTSCIYPNVTHTCVRTYDSPQVQLGRDCRTHSAFSTATDTLKTEINEYLPTNYYASGRVSSASNLAQRMTNTLREGYPVILGVKAYKLDYYNNNTAFDGHFVLVEKYDPTTETVYIADPCYDRRYYGRHTATLDEVYNALFVNGHQIIW